ncbi:MAG: hypothetical protein AAB840_00315 [Patescibacteria group bacterium]
MIKFFKKILIYAFVLFLPVLTFAVGEGGEGLLEPDCDGVEIQCTFGQFFRFVQDIIEFLIFYLSIPVAVLLVIWAGWLYLTTGIVDKKSKAKDILWAVFIGFAIMLSAWLIIDFILGVFLSETYREVPNVL